MKSIASIIIALYCPIQIKKHMSQVSSFSKHYKKFSMLFQTFVRLIYHHDGCIAESNFKRTMHLFYLSKRKLIFKKLQKKYKQKIFILLTRPIFYVFPKNESYTTVISIYWSENNFNALRFHCSLRLKHSHYHHQRCVHMSPSCKF